MLTIFGVLSATVMVVAYALESRGRVWIAIFAAACLTTALYGVLTESWIFAALETIWAAIALRRFAATAATSEQACD